MPWKIDRLQFDTVDGQLFEAEPVDSELVREGADGTAFQVDAYRASTQTLTATVRKPVGQAGDVRASCKALETRTVSVVDQHGWTWTCYVRRVRVSWAYNPDGQYWIRATFSLVPKSERP